MRAYGPCIRVLQRAEDYKPIMCWIGIWHERNSTKVQRLSSYQVTHTHTYAPRTTHISSHTLIFSHIYIRSYTYPLTYTNTSFHTNILSIHTYPLSRRTSCFTGDTHAYAYNISSHDLTHTRKYSLADTHARAYVYDIVLR